MLELTNTEIALRGDLASQPLAYPSQPRGAICVVGGDMLTLLDPKFLKMDTNGHKHYKGLYLCDCGKPTLVVPAKVKSGHTKSCGCSKYKIKHGYSKHPFYNKYNSMIDRCYNTNNPTYKNYGGRGITVCDEWRKHPETFFVWAEKVGIKTGVQIDRIDNNKGYSPDNCRFTTPEINQQNKRTNKLNKEKVLDILKELKKGTSATKLALKYNVHRGMIYAIKYRRTWKNINIGEKV